LAITIPPALIQSPSGSREKSNGSVSDLLRVQLLKYAVAVFYYDLVIFGTANVLIYEDYDAVINCVNPALGEYFVDIDGKFPPDSLLARASHQTVAAVGSGLGCANCSTAVQQLYDDPFRRQHHSRNQFVAHSIEPNNDGRAEEFGFSKRFAYREVYWEWGGSTSPQGGSSNLPSFLRKRGYYEQMAITGRWDIVFLMTLMVGLRSGCRAAASPTGQRGSQAVEAKMVKPHWSRTVQLKNQPGQPNSRRIRLCLRIFRLPQAGLA